MNKAVKRGLHVKIILSPVYNVDDDYIDIQQELGGLDCEIKTFNVPLVKAVIRDENEMLMAVSKIEDKKIISLQL